MITSAGNRKPANADRDIGAGCRRVESLTDPIPPDPQSTNATDPFGAILLVFGLTGQAMIEGVEMIGYTVTQDERINHAAFIDVTNHLAGLPESPSWPSSLSGASLGIVIAMLAVWRGRAVPGIAAALPVAFQVAQTVGAPFPATARYRVWLTDTAPCVS